MGGCGISRGDWSELRVKPCTELMCKQLQQVWPWRMAPKAATELGLGSSRVGERRVCCPTAHLCQRHVRDDQAPDREVGAGAGLVGDPQRL